MACAVRVCDADHAVSMKRTRLTSQHTTAIDSISLLKSTRIDAAHLLICVDSAHQQRSNSRLQQLCEGKDSCRGSLASALAIQMEVQMDKSLCCFLTTTSLSPRTPTALVPPAMRICC